MAGLALLRAPRLAEAFSAQPGEEVLTWLDQPAPNPVPEVIGHQLQWEDLDSWITPNDQFFTIAHYDKPVLDAATWRLQIGGLVQQPMVLTHAALVFVGGTEARRLLAVAPGTAPADDDEQIDFEDRLLRPAVRANLLSREGGRYDLDPPVRAYLEQRRPPDSTARIAYRRRHAEAHLTVARTTTRRSTRAA